MRAPLSRLALLRTGAFVTSATLVACLFVALAVRPQTSFVIAASDGTSHPRLPYSLDDLAARRP